jgi:hypothetical protein
MDSFLLTATAVTLLLIGSGMLLLEISAVKAARRFFKNDFTRMVYWMTYLFALVLGATMLIKAVTIAV